MIHVLIGIVLAQGDEYFRSPDDSLVVLNVAHLKSSDLNVDEGTMSAAGTGTPIHVLLNSLGLALDAESIDVSAKQSAVKAWYLTKAHARSKVVVKVNSEVGAAWQKAHRPPVRQTDPPQPSSEFAMESEGLDYSGSETQGDITIPTPFASNGKIDGVRVGMAEGETQAIRYSETFRFLGSSGELKLDPTPGAGVRTVRSGRFEGPITFSADRDEFIQNGVPLSHTHLKNGQCDRVGIATDPTGETITLEGHVRFDLETEKGTSHFRNGDTGVIRLDPALTLLSVKGSGSPLETSVPFLPKKQ